MRKVRFQTDIIVAHLESIPLPKLTKEQTLSFKRIISEDEVFQSLKSMEKINHLKIMDSLRNFMNDSGMKSKIRF